MGAERWTFDGWELEAAGLRGWEYRSGTDAVSPVIGGNSRVSLRTGELWRPKVLGPGKFTLALWLAGTDRTAVWKQYQLVQRAVIRPHRQVLVLRYMPDGTAINCLAEATGGITPTFIGQRGYQATIDFGVPAGVWRSNEVVTNFTNSGFNATTKTLRLTNFADSTATMDDLRFSLHGGAIAPQIVDITDGDDGESVKYNGNMNSTQLITFDSGTWAVEANFAVNRAAVVSTGRRLLAVPAARPGDVPAVQLRMGNGGDGNTQLVVSGRRSYLC